MKLKLVKNYSSHFCIAFFVKQKADLTSQKAPVLSHLSNDILAEVLLLVNKHFDKFPPFFMICFHCFQQWYPPQLFPLS